MTGVIKPASNQRLRYERERRAWSQQEVADRVGTTPLNVGRWERGVTFPNPYFRQKLCEVFEKSAQELGLIPESSDESKRVEPAQPLTTPITASMQELPASFWNVPYNRNLLFTGREDILAQLRSSLISEERPIALAQPQAISGLGGIGKTQTAVEYAYRYRENYDAVLWARADSPDLLISDFLLIAALLNLPQRNEQDQSVVVKAVLRWFDTHEGWLLILDNADQLEMISEFIPSAGKGHVLLTTRAHSSGTVAQRIEIEKMGLDEGTALLLRRIKRLKGNTGLEIIPEPVRDQARAIVEAVDGLPLALDQAGAYIEDTGCSLVDYLRFFKTRRNRLLRTRGRDVTGHPEPVATTWSLSFEKVEQANPAAAELLRLCAFLHADEIPEAMIVEGASELGPVLQPVAEDELDWNEAIGELHKYSLVRRDAEKKILNVHRLVQAVLKDAMDEERQREWAERTVRVVNRAFPNSKEIALWPKCQQYLPHAQTCTELIKQWEIIVPEAAQLLNQIGSYLYERGQYIEAECLLRHALTIHEQVLGLNHPDIVQNLSNLARLYFEQSKYEQAEQLCQRALAIYEQALGTRHSSRAETLTTLARICQTQSKFEQAELLYHQALTIYEQVLGTAHPDIGDVLSALGELYRTQGRYEEAEKFLQRTLAISEDVMGTKHPYTATVLNNLAELYRSQGQYEEAEQLFQRALTIREQMLGPQHSQTATTLNNLAKLYRDQGKYTEAKSFFQRSLTIREQTLGPEHYRTAETLNDLAVLYCFEGKYTEAEPLFQRALTIRGQRLGPKHIEVAITLENYAILLRKTGRESEGAPLEARAQAIRAKQE